MQPNQYATTTCIEDFSGGSDYSHFYGYCKKFTTESYVPAAGGGGSAGTTTIANAPMESFALVAIWFMIATSCAFLVYIFSK